MEEPRYQNEPNEFAEKWRLLHDRYRRSDNELWKGTELERATDKKVSSSYVTAIKNGSIKDPGLKYLRAIAKAMGFPFEYWTMEVEELRERLAEGPITPPPTAEEERGGDTEDVRVADAVNLFDR